MPDRDVNLRDLFDTTTTSDQVGVLLEEARSILAELEGYSSREGPPRSGRATGPTGSQGVQGGQGIQGPVAPPGDLVGSRGLIRIWHHLDRLEIIMLFL